MARSINFGELVKRFQPDLLPEHDPDVAYIFDHRVFKRSAPMPAGHALPKPPRRTFTFAEMIHEQDPAFLHTLDVLYEFARGRKFYQSRPMPGRAGLSKPSRRSTTFGEQLRDLGTVDPGTGKPVRFVDWVYIFQNGRRFRFNLDHGRYDRLYCRPDL